MTGRILFSALIALCVVLALGCGALKPFGVGNDDGAVLHFTGRDESEKDFRARMQKTAQDNPAGMALLCKQLEGPSAGQALALIRQDDDAEGGPIPPGAIRKEGQVATEKDLARSEKVIKDECKRAKV